jgi:hypothetical protein
VFFTFGGLFEDEVMGQIGRTDLKAGAKVKIVANTSGHGLHIGAKTTVVTSLTGGTYRIANNMNVYPNDLESDCGFTRADVEAERKDMKLKLDLLDAKLAFLDETGRDSGTDSEVKVYSTLVVFENEDLTRLQKAEAIAALIDN